ncbi:MAG: sigma-70 family RNA polymerase sigma factor [Clostridia bacterium]
MENELLMLLRSDKKTSRRCRCKTPLGRIRRVIRITLIDVLEDSDDTIMERVDYKMSQGKLYQAVNKVLTGREREVIIMRYGLAGKTPMTQREVAKVLDISRSYVSRIEKKAIQKLSREMTGQVIEWVDEEL